MNRPRGKIAWSCCKLGKAFDIFGRVLHSKVNQIFSRTHLCWLDQPLPSNADDHFLPWTTWRMARFKCKMTVLMSTAPSSLSRRLCSNILRRAALKAAKQCVSQGWSNQVVLAGMKTAHMFHLVNARKKRWPICAEHASNSNIGWCVSLKGLNALPHTEATKLSTPSFTHALFRRSTFTLLIRSDSASKATRTASGTRCSLPMMT